MADAVNYPPKKTQNAKVLFLKNYVSKEEIHRSPVPAERAGRALSSLVGPVSECGARQVARNRARESRKRRF